MTQPAGRSNEVDWTTSRVGSRQSVVVAGELGVGKTALLRHVSERLRLDGATVRVISASSAAARIPFGAFAGFIDPSDGMDPAVKIAAAIERVGRPAGGDPHVLFVDDAQHLDVQSIAVLHGLAVDGDAVMMASLRSTDPVPPELADLLRHAEVARLELQPLDDVATAAIVREVLDSVVDDDVVADLVRRSGGNPLFARELAAAHREGSPAGLTPQLLELVGNRIDALTPDEQDQLTMVAIGQPLDVGLPVVEPEVLASLEHAALVATRVDDGVVVALPAHPIYAEVIRTQLTPLRRRDVSHRLGMALVDQPQTRRGDALRVVNWLLDAGDRPPAGLARAAAFEALGWLDVELAEQLATMSVEDVRSAASLFALGEVRRLSGHPAEAAVLWREAFELASEDDDIRKVGLALGQLHQLFLRDYDGAREVLIAARDRIRDPALRLGIESDLAMETRRADRRSSIEAVEQLLADPDCGDESAWTALANLLWAKATGLDLSDVDRHLARAAEIEQRLPADRDAETDLIHALRVNILFEQGRLREAISCARELAADCAARGIASGVTVFSCGLIHHACGELDVAAQAAQEALVQLGAFDAFNAAPMVTMSAAIYAAACGDVDRASALVEQGIEPSGDDAPWLNIWLPRARAWIAAASGDAPTAIAAAIDAGKRGIEAAEMGWGILALHDAVAWGAADEVVDLLERERGHIVECAFFDIVLDHAVAAAEANAGGLAHCARRFEACGARWYAATAWANRAAAARDDVEACRDATRAMALSAPVGLRPGTPELAISPRQLDTARRAAGGTTSRRIADELFLSPRTVDNHLREAYRKLGVSSRTELADVVDPAARA